MARRCGAKHIFKSKCTKHLMVGDPEKWHAAVARSTFVSQNVQNTAFPKPFLKLRSGKMARRCGAKRMCKSKCQKIDGFGPLLNVPMSVSQLGN